MDFFFNVHVVFDGVCDAGLLMLVLVLQVSLGVGGRKLIFFFFLAGVGGQLVAEEKDHWEENSPDPGRI